MAVVIVNYNTSDHLRACLATVQSESSSQVIVVDNASTDGSVEMVKREYPWVTLIPNSTNKGYGTAANQGIFCCRDKYVLLLNADILLPPGALQALITYLDLNPQAAVVGPRAVRLDGKLESTCYQFPGTLKSLVDSDTLGKLIRYIPGIRHHFLRTWPHDHSRVVPWVKGMALAIRYEVFKAVGGFDESFFLFFEEVDLCYRLAASGRQIHFAPVTSVLHIGGASTIQTRSDAAIQLFKGEIQFFQSHYSGMHLKVLMVSMKLLSLVRLIRNCIHLHFTANEVRRSRIIENITAEKCILLEPE